MLPNKIIGYFIGAGLVILGCFCYLAIALIFDFWRYQGRKDTETPSPKAPPPPSMPPTKPHTEVLSCPFPALLALSILARNLLSSAGGVTRQPNPTKGA